MPSSHQKVTDSLDLNQYRKLAANTFEDLRSYVASHHNSAPLESDLANKTLGYCTRCIDEKKITSSKALCENLLVILNRASALLKELNAKPAMKFDKDGTLSHIFEKLTEALPSLQVSSPKSVSSIDLPSKLPTEPEKKEEKIVDADATFTSIVPTDEKSAYSPRRK